MVLNDRIFHLLKSQIRSDKCLYYCSNWFKNEPKMNELWKPLAGFQSCFYSFLFVVLTLMPLTIIRWGVIINLVLFSVTGFFIPLLRNGTPLYSHLYSLSYLWICLKLLGKVSVLNSVNARHEMNTRPPSGRNWPIFIFDRNILNMAWDCDSWFLEQLAK